jgi:general secretion pathway protein L
MKLYFTVDPPHHWVRVGENGVEASGVAAELKDVPADLLSRPCTAVVPGEWVAIHHVSVPARSRAKMLAAVPYALEESLSADVEDLHFVPIHWKVGEPAVVAVVAQKLVSDWLEACSAAGLPIDSIVPDYTLLPIHPATQYTLAVQPDSRLLIRSADGDGIALDQDILGSWLDQLPEEAVSLAVNNQDQVREIISSNRDVDVRYWDFGDDFDSWLAHDSSNEVNLLQGEFRQKSRTTSLSSFRIAIILVSCAIGLKLLSDAWLYFSLSSESRRLDQEMAQLVTDTFPHITNVIPSREQFIMQQEIDKLRGVQVASGDYLLFLSSVAKATQGQEVTVEDLTYREGKLTVSCSVSDFGAVDRLQQRFTEDARVRVELASSSASEGRVTGRFVIEPAI